MATPEDKIRQAFEQAFQPAQRQVGNDPVQQAMDKVFNPQLPDMPEAVPRKGFGGTVVSVIAPVVDFLARPQYASAAFFEGMMDETKSIFDVISDSFNEIIDPKLRLSYTDIIKKRAPEFAKANPKVTSVLGFLGDVALDPTTYLGVGLAGKGIKVGGKIVTKTGEAVRNNIIRTMEGRQFFMTAVGDEVSKDLARKGVGSLQREMLVQDQAQINFYRIAEQLDALDSKEFKSLENVQKKLAKQGIIVDVNQLVSPQFATALRNKERKLTKELLLEERKKIEPLIAREFDMAAVNKELARKEVKGVVQEVTPGRIKKEIDVLKKEYEEQMADIGIGNIQVRGQGGKFGKKPATELALGELGIEGVPQDFTRVLVRKLQVEEVVEKAEERMMRLANQDTTVSDRLFAKSKLSLKIGLPFTTKFDKEILTLTGLGPLKKSVDFIKALNHSVVIKNIPIASPIARMLETTGVAFIGAKETAKGLFVRPGDEPFKSVITNFENSYDYIEGQVLRETRRLYDGMTEERRGRLTAILRQVDSETRKIEFIEDRTITQIEANTIYDNALANTNLTADEMSVVAGLKQEYANVAALEMDANLLKSEIKNYHPRYYDSLSDTEDMTAITRVKYGLGTDLTSSQKRKFVTHQEAELAGLIPEMDAAMIYATRVTSSRRALVKKQFFEDLETTFQGQYRSITGKELKISSQNDLVKLAVLPNGKKYLDDIKLLGESVYPVGMNESSKAFLRGIDWATGLFRRVATVYKPSFAPKQAVSNTAQIMLELGLKGAKTFDPRALADTSMLLFDFYRGAKTSTLPKYISNLISKNFGGEGSDAVLASRLALNNIIGEERLLDVANEFSMKTAFGVEYTGTDLVRIMRENNVIRGVDVTGDTFKQNIQSLLEYNPNNRFKVTQELAKYWKFPSIVEDYGRGVAFMGFLRQGYSPKQATQKVNEVLFDYKRGLTQFERNVARRIVPFYCVKSETQVLSRTGWKYHWELNIGDELLTYNCETQVQEWQPCLEVAVFDCDEDITKFSNSDIEFTCTNEHRWVVQQTHTPHGNDWWLSDPFLLQTNELNSSHKILVSAPLNESEESILTVEDARLLGWAMTDGSIRKTGNHYEVNLYQTPGKFLNDVMTVAGANCISYNRSIYVHPINGCVTVPVPKEKINPLIKYLDPSRLSEVVLKLGLKEAEAMYDAMYKADGSICESRKSDFFAAQQNYAHKNYVREAFRLLCVLLGKRTSESFRGILIQKNKHIGVKDLKRESVHYKGKVWCPRTANQTVIFKEGNHISISGQTFQRFAIPFVMKKMIEKPGVIAGANKFVGLLERLLVDENDTLNPSEREIFGDSFYVEQPRVFTGFDKDGKAKFNILNNMTPLDALSLMVYDPKTGELNLQRTIEKTVLATITPFLKVPIEMAIDKNFFTGRTVSEGQRIGDYSFLPGFVKDAIGWEDRTNLSTGKTATYVNTYLGYSVMNAVPALRQFLNIGDTSKSNLDKAMEFVVGVVPKGIDLKELKEWQSLGDLSKIRDITDNIRNAKLRGGNTEYESSLQEYRDYLEVIKQGNILKNQNQVRGQGILGQRQQIEEEKALQEQK